MQHIIVIGGGVAGLLTSNWLAQQGYEVTVLEGSNRLGGRIHTVHDSNFERPVERGVEFIHGDLPLTMQLLKEAGIEYSPVRGQMIRVVDGEWKTQDDFTVGWKELMDQMNELREDTTLEEFLKKNFTDNKYNSLKKSVLRFAQGFDLADPSKASVVALREEWMGEEGEQYRVPGGFDQLINYLQAQCLKSGVQIQTSSQVSNIEWQKNKVSVRTTGGKVYNGDKIVITVSLATVSASPPIILFQPAINNYMDACKKIGFGSVVKVLLQFEKAFWKDRKRNIGFLFTEEIVPTWWTQAPSTYALLTGWAGGPQASELESKDDSAIMELALTSLSNIFDRRIDELKTLLTASLVANWNKDPFAKGAYSYSMVGSTAAQKLLNTPIDDTIFFAGEAYYDGPSPGTVEAALVSAKNVVGRICQENL